MTRVRVPDGVLGVDGPGGRRYDTDRRGYVHIDDPAYGRLAKQALGRGLGDASIGFAHAPVASLACPTCHFERWPWQDNCPRCAHKEMSA